MILLSKFFTQPPSNFGTFWHQKIRLSLIFVLLRRGWDLSRSLFARNAKSSLVQGWRTICPRHIVRRLSAHFGFRLNSRLASNLFESQSQIQNKTSKLLILFCTRRGWDSNPRSACTNDSFQDCSIRPLWHLSN